jgi:hypothetical protein
MTNRIWLPAAGFALLWIVVSVAAPGTTFHLAPAIVAATPALRDPINRIGPTIGGTLVAGLIAVGLAAAGRLDGPSLLPAGGALLESLLAAAVGGAVGLLFAGRLSPSVSDGRH